MHEDDDSRSDECRSWTEGSTALWLNEAEVVAVHIRQHDRTGAGVTNVEARSAEREEVIERGLHVAS
jgi:hypothetical protein